MTFPLQQDRIRIQVGMSQLFEIVASQFQSASQYQRFIKECEREYDIKVYRLSAFAVSYAKKIYSDLAEKYRDRLMEPNPHGWYENQRRLYVWFVLCFMHYKVLDSSKFVDSCDKYWRSLSEVFWQKEIYFLKYQLLTICKAKGRTVWREKEDVLLKRIFKDFKLGEWNEIAKEFYKESGGQFFKTPKQCRQRWQNHLNEGIRKGEWSKEEDLVIFQFIAQNQRKNWAQMVKALHQTRTEHMIKNRYKSLTTKMMAERDITEEQAAQTILNSLLGKEEEEQQEFQIKEVQSEDVPVSEGEKERLMKSPKRGESELMNPNNLMDMSSLVWMKSDRRGSGIVWPMAGQSINGFNRSMSNFGSIMIFDKSINLLKFPDIPKEEERKNTIFDPSESLLNSAKNADSVIIKVITPE